MAIKQTCSSYISDIACLKLGQGESELRCQSVIGRCKGRRLHRHLALTCENLLLGYPGKSKGRCRILSINKGESSHVLPSSIEKMKVSFKNC